MWKGIRILAPSAPPTKAVYQPQVEQEQEDVTAQRKKGKKLFKDLIEAEAAFLERLSPEARDRLDMQ